MRTAEVADIASRRTGAAVIGWLLSFAGVLVSTLIARLIARFLPPELPAALLAFSAMFLGSFVSVCIGNEITHAVERRNSLKRVDIVQGVIAGLRAALGR